MLKIIVEDFIIEDICEVADNWITKTNEYTTDLLQLQDNKLILIQKNDNEIINVREIDQEPKKTKPGQRIMRTITIEEI